MHYRTIDTPVGAFALLRRPGGAVEARWLDDGERLDGTPDEGHLSVLAERLRRYFQGEPVDFDDVPTPDGPAFARRCWDACRAIPRGSTATYGQLAGLGAARAAGQAMRHNPLPVIVPCHRVVAAGGAMHGYAGQVDPASRELSIKRFLLELERPGGVVRTGGLRESWGTRGSWVAPEEDQR